MFDPFFTTKEASEGLGLGLSISARIIEDLDGCLSVSSSDLGGARFEILLPSAEDPSRMAPCLGEVCHNNEYEEPRGRRRAV